MYPESANILFRTLSNYQLNKVLRNINAEKAIIACEGTAQWDWETCTVIFTITRVYTEAIGNACKNVTVFVSNSENDTIKIKKKYTEGDITESDVLVALFKNNTLVFEDYNNYNECIANEVNFNNEEHYIHYYTYPSMYTIYDEQSKDYVNYQFCLKCTLNVNQSPGEYSSYSTSDSPCAHNNIIHNTIPVIDGNKIQNSQNSILDTITNNKTCKSINNMQITILDKIAKTNKKTRDVVGKPNWYNMRKLCTSHTELINCWKDAS